MAYCSPIVRNDMNIHDLIPNTAKLMGVTQNYGMPEDAPVRKTRLTKEEMGRYIDEYLTKPIKAHIRDMMEQEIT